MRRLISLFSVNKKRRLIARLLDENYRLRCIIDSIPNSVYWKNKAGIYLGRNTFAADKMQTLHLETDQQIGSILGKSDFDLFEKEMAEKFRENDERVLKERKTVTTEETTYLPDGSKLVQLSIKTPLYNRQGELVGLIGNTIDVTDVSELKERLKSANDRVTHNDALKNAFVQNFEHDIRTPFQGLCVLSEVLANQESDESKKQTLSMIYQSARELLNLCNQMFSFSKEDKQYRALVDKTISLKSFIAGIIRIEKPACVAKQLLFHDDLDADVPEYIVTDPYRLRAILINVLSNAIKFTHAGQIDFKIQTKPSKGGVRDCVLEFMIKDTGIGIQSHQLDGVYERFHRLNPSNAGQYSGHGLGLAIVKKYLTELEGEIHVESTISKGTTFWICVPVKLPLSDKIDDALMQHEGIL